jgi:hypothetical protein
MIAAMSTFEDGLVVQQKAAAAARDTTTRPA